MNHHALQQPDVCVRVFGVANCSRPDEWIAATGFKTIRPLSCDPSGQKTVAVQASGNSMSEDRIEDGDWVICLWFAGEIGKVDFSRFQGKIFLIATPNGPVLKRIVPGMGAAATLRSSNPNFPDIRISTDDFQILGVALRIEIEL
jgi:SOS-response transcriptional repressor LexA